MPDINYVLLYVDNPPASAAFYAGLLGRPPVDVSPTFALFAMTSGLMFGLWSKDGVEPKPAGNAGSSEIAIKVDDADAVQRYPCRLGEARPANRAGANRDGFRHHFRGARSGRSSPAGVFDTHRLTGHLIGHGAGARGFLVPAPMQG